jgi:uncharacterized coiled-coil protein SlyX
MSMKKKMSVVKTNPVKEYKIATTIIISFLIVFLTSKMWLPNADKVQSTSVGVTQRVSTVTELTLSSWEYNPTVHFMEVIFSIADDKNFNRSEFVTTAKISRAKSLNTKIVLKENSMMVVHIENVPKDFEVISLWVEQKKDQNTNAEQYNKANFKCNYRKVIIDNNLKVKTKNEYLMQSIETEIANVKKQISDIENTISEKQKQQKYFEEDIRSIKSDLKYQTDEEVKDSNNVIENKEKYIASLNSQIEVERKNISSLNEKLIKLNLKLDDAKKENTLGV